MFISLTIIEEKEKSLYIFISVPNLLFLYSLLAKERNSLSTLDFSRCHWSWINDRFFPLWKRNNNNIIFLINTHVLKTLFEAFERREREAQFLNTIFVLQGGGGGRREERQWKSYVLEMTFGKTAGDKWYLRAAFAACIWKSLFRWLKSDICFPRCSTLFRLFLNLTRCSTSQPARYVVTPKHLAV